MPHARTPGVHPSYGAGNFGVAERGIMALVNPERLRRILAKMLDENEFLGPHGIRAISKFHEQHPYVFYVNGAEYKVDYLPAESNTGMFGGNSNWRGPVWMPVNAMIIRALLQFYLYYGDNFKIECPTGSGRMMNLFEVAKEIADRLTGIFLRDEHGRRPVYGGTEEFNPILTGATSSCSTNTSMATMALGWARATRQAGPGLWPNSSNSSAVWTPSGYWRRARCRLSKKRGGEALACVSHITIYQIMTFADLAGKKSQLQDQLHQANYEWNGDDLQGSAWTWCHGNLRFSLWQSIID